MQSNLNRSRRRPGWGAPILALALTFGLSGCDKLLEVSNPNNIAGDDILNPSAAEAMANGALSGVAQGFGFVLTSYSTVTDELEWSGSRDAYNEHDQGQLDNVFNEYTDLEFPRLAQGRWMADEAVRVLLIHDGAGELEDRADLGRAWIWSAVPLIAAGAMFDDFTFSDRAAAGAPVGEANMAVVYDGPIPLPAESEQSTVGAIQRLTNAIAIAQAIGNSDIETMATATRARAHFERALFDKTGTRPINTSSPLVSSAAAVADAQRALTLAGDPDYKFQFVYSASTVSPRIGFQVNERREMRFALPYASPQGVNDWDAVVFEDLIDVGTVSPELLSIINAFDSPANGESYPTLTFASSRGMHLIIAEDALARGVMAEFATAINNLRALDGLTAWSMAAPQVPALDLLIHSRQTNLYLQGRRLADHYRFQIVSPQWSAGSAALVAPGTFLPIPVIECRANENLPSGC